MSPSVILIILFMSFVFSPFVGGMMPEQVLNLAHIFQLKNGLYNYNIKRWSVQRIRLSPQEKHLAATVKSDYREELRSKQNKHNVASL